MSEDRERFEELFREHYGSVLRYAVRRVGVDIAAEIVSETFLTAWRRLDAVPDNALPWLYATARRLVANEVRRQARARRLGERLIATADRAGSDPAEAISEQVSDRARVRAALATLSERDREVLRLAIWEQLGTADAARVMDCSQSAYKLRLHRARRRLASQINLAEARRGELVHQGGSR